MDRDLITLTIYTDSQFLINCMELWVPIWQTNGWRKTDGRKVANWIELEELSDVIFESNINVMFEFVPGHAGIEGNIEADRLAREAAIAAPSYKPCSCCGGPMVDYYY